MATLLLKAGARLVVHPTRGSPLHVACVRCNPHMVQALLEAEDAGSALNAATRDTRRTALHCCMLAGSAQSSFAAESVISVVAALLLSVGATGDLQDSLGDTPLTIAAKRGGQLEPIKVLLQSGAWLVCCD